MESLRIEANNRDEPVEYAGLFPVYIADPEGIVADADERYIEDII